MINLRMNLLVVTFGLFAGACAGGGGNVETGFDPDQDFSTYQSFAWAQQPPMRASGQYGPDEAAAELMTAAVKSSFEKKGYRFVDEKEAADFSVSFTVGARDSMEVQTYFPFHRYGRPGLDVESYTTGSLSVDVFDRKRNKHVWHAVGSKVLSDEEKQGVPRDDADYEKVLDQITAAFPRRR